MHEATDALLCIKNIEKLSNSKRDCVSKSSYFKSPNEIEKTFSDLPEAISNTLLVAKKCSFILEQSKPNLPKFLSSNEDENNQLYQISHDGLQRKLLEIKKKDIKNFYEEKYNERLNYELNIIKKTGYSGYFLIVSDFISWAKKKKYPLDQVGVLALDL